MELLTTIAVIAILATLLVPALQSVQARVEKVNCTNNLRQLYVSGNSYILEYGHWPQVNPVLLHGQNNAYDEAWIEAFMPYGAGRQTWICPTVQHLLGGIDYTQPPNYRTDYIAMPFDIKHVTPNRWPRAPWFIERANVHGDGNLVMLTNGAVTSLSQFVPPSQGSNTAFPSSPSQ